MTHNVFSVGLLATTMLIVGCKKEPVVEPGPRAVRVVRVGDMTTLEGRSLPGRAEASNEIDLAFRVPGTLHTLPIKVGEVVQEGALLARLDPRDYEVRILDVEGQLASNTAEIAQTEIELAQVTDLEQQGAASKIELERIKARLGSLLGVKQSLTASLEAARNDLAYTQLVAPFGGRVAATYVNNFQTLQANEPVLRLLDTSRIKVTVDIPEDRISLVPFVNEILVSFDAFPDLAVSAQIHEVGNEASPTTRTYPVTIMMDQPEGVEILPGMSCEVTTRGKLPEGVGAEGLEVPLSALLEGAEAGQSAVWLLDEGAQAVRQHPVQTVRLTAHGVMVKGLQPGNLIVTAGVHFLKEGQKVRVLGRSDGPLDPNPNTDSTASPAEKGSGS